MPKYIYIYFFYGKQLAVSTVCTVTPERMSCLSMFITDSRTKVGNKKQAFSFYLDRFPHLTRCICNISHLFSNLQQILMLLLCSFPIFVAAVIATVDAILHYNADQMLHSMILACWTLWFNCFQFTKWMFVLIIALQSFRLGSVFDLSRNILGVKYRHLQPA